MRRLFTTVAKETAKQSARKSALQQDAKTGLYYLQKGNLKVFVATPDDKKQPLLSDVSKTEMEIVERGNLTIHRPVQQQNNQQIKAASPDSSPTLDEDRGVNQSIHHRL